MSFVARSSRGAIAGIVGTAALMTLEPLERIAVGRTPVYAPSAIARSLARAYAHGRLGDRAARRWGAALRWLYGAGLGEAYGVARPERRKSRLALPLLFGLAIAAGELVALPAARATPRANRWTTRERALRLAHTIAFALLADAVLGWISPRAREVLATAPTQPERVEKVPPGRACFTCGRPASWRIAIAGEDEPLDEANACDAHARGHLRMTRLVIDELS